MARNGWSALLFCAALACQPASAQSSFDSDGYRSSHYRAPVDVAPDPAARITLAEALHLHRRKRALFIDVVPVESGYRDPATGTWKQSQPHKTIPGAIWHPETGRAHPAPVLWQALLAAVEAKRLQHPEAPVVVYCRTDCWMGWNAARRLAIGGVEKVYWLAEGVEGWHAAGRKLVDVQPVIVAP